MIYENDCRDPAKKTFNSFPLLMLKSGDLLWPARDIITTGVCGLKIEGSSNLSTISATHYGEKTQAS